MIESRYQPDLRTELAEYLASAGSTKLHGRSRIVREYEDEVLRLFGYKHGVACNSGTSALELALRAASPDRAATVLAPAFMPVMTVLPILDLGLNCVLYDNEPSSVFPDLLGLAQISSSLAPPGTVLVTVTWWGYVSQWAELRAMADHRGWIWIDDSAQAHGSSHHTARPDIRAYSTHDRKLLTTGEGGLALTDSDGFARRMRSFASYGGLPDAIDQDLELGVEVGSNRRLSSVAAALGIASAKRLPETISEREARSASLDQLLAGLNSLVPHPRTPHTSHNHYGYCLVAPAMGAPADYQIGGRLQELGVQNDAHDYRLSSIRSFPIARDLKGDDANVRRFTSRVLPLSPHSGLSPADLDTIATAVRTIDHEITSMIGRT